MRVIKWQALRKSDFMFIAIVMIVFFIQTIICQMNVSILSRVL